MKRVLVTGGMGFIGFNAALHRARLGDEVVLFDDLSRPTALKNHAEFKKLSPARLRLMRGDVRRPADLRRAMKSGAPFNLILHLAGQVAVTTSVTDPRRDFEINALGTFNVLEAARRFAPKAFLIYSSTNKVYGSAEWALVGKNRTRYFFKRPANGVDEEAPLDFHSPYGCSKGAADQYVRDYARIYGLKTAVFRQSCIYGPWQYGEEDQGWVAWFLIAALSRRPITIFGDGKQARDILHVDDLLALYDRAFERADRCAGQVFNAGGGPRMTLSLVELLAWMRGRLGFAPSLRWTGWRPGDQKVYVSDTRKAARKLGWRPKISVDEGLDNLLAWLEPRVGRLSSLRFR